MKVGGFSAGISNPAFLAVLGLQALNTFQNARANAAATPDPYDAKFTNAALATGQPVTSMPGGFFRQLASKTGLVSPDVQASPDQMNQENLALQQNDRNKVKDLGTLTSIRAAGGPGIFQSAMDDSPLGRMIKETGSTKEGLAAKTPAEIKQDAAIAHQNDTLAETKRGHDLTDQRATDRMAADEAHWRVDTGLRRANLDISAAREGREAKAQQAMDDLLSGVAGSIDGDTIDKALPGTEGMNKAATLAASTKAKANLMYSRTGDPKVDNVRRVLAGNTGFKEWLQYHPEVLINKNTLATGIRAYQKESQDFTKSQTDIDASLNQIDQLSKFMEDNKLKGDSWADVAKGGYRHSALLHGLPEDPIQRKFGDLISQLNSTATRSYVTGTRFGSKYLDRVTAHLPKEGGTPDSIRQDVMNLKAFLLNLKAARTPIEFETKVTGAPNSTSPVDAFEAE